MARLLICGDSFSCSGHGTWTDTLQGQKINLSQAGASEYRIWLQWTRAHAGWDAAVICHTSPNRIYCETDFFHDPWGTHKNCDLIYKDLVARRGQPLADHAIWWFENVFDIEQADFYHKLLIRHWIALTEGLPVVHISFFDLQISGIECFYNLWQQFPGSINHMDTKGNLQASNSVAGLLQAVLAK